MMDIDTPDFASKDDEIQFWMDLAHQMHQRLVFSFFPIYYIYKTHNCKFQKQLKK